MTTQPTVKFFRKKPIPVAAIEWTGANLREVIEFTGLHPSAQKWTWEEYEAVVEREGLKIFTREGALMAQIGDWIMRGVKGEFWPIKPDILSETYDEVQEPANTPNDKTELPARVERLRIHLFDLMGMTPKSGSGVLAQNALSDILAGFRELAEVKKENEKLRAACQDMETKLYRECEKNRKEWNSLTPEQRQELVTEGTSIITHDLFARAETVEKVREKLSHLIGGLECGGEKWLAERVNEILALLPKSEQQKEEA